MYVLSFVHELHGEEEDGRSVAEIGDLDQSLTSLTQKPLQTDPECEYRYVTSSNFDRYDVDQLFSISRRSTDPQRDRKRAETGMYSARAVERVIGFLARVSRGHHHHPSLVLSGLLRIKSQGIQMSHFQHFT